MRQLNEGARLVDRYTLQRPAGSGGMAVLWRAHDARSDMPVVLKFLADSVASSERQRERFRQEWRIASRLMHAHIVRVFEYHETDDGPFYAQQYVDGPSIAELAGQPTELLLRPFGLLADALRYAHGKQIVHGDIKAANVRLDKRGAPYLLDFGCAVSSGAPETRGGTPIAMSVQQKAGEPAHPADDIFALGVLLHELLFSRPPADGNIPVSTGSGDTLPTSVRELLTAMLADDRGARPTAGAVCDALQAAGFRSGPAQFAGPSRGAVASDTEITVQSIRPAQVRGVQVGPPPTAVRRGIPVPYVIGGLAVMLAALLAVLFLLPVAVDTDTGIPRRAVSPSTDGGDSPQAVDAPPSPAAPAETESLPFNENRGAAGQSGTAHLKSATDEVLGDLLSQLERLRYRGIERWGGDEYLAIMNVYAEGDRAYVAREYGLARQKYLETSRRLEPFFDRIPEVFRAAMDDARVAFEARDFREAIRLYDLAVAVTPGHPAAQRGLARARNLESVLSLMERARVFESNLEFAAARQAYESVLELDAEWQAAIDGLARVRAAIEQRSFEQRMTEGFTALAAGNYDIARAAFETARAMRPGSPQPADGLQQLDQALRLERISNLKSAAEQQEENEQWEAAVDSYEEALSVDPDLRFAKEGLQRAGYRAGLHSKLAEYINDPDSLSAPPRMQAATQLLLELSRVSPQGPRLDDQKETLARLLKRAATPLTVRFVSDNMTDVSIYRVGPLGTFAERTLDLRPGKYVAVGSRPGYRDVRLEFHVAPEIEMAPIVVRCEEAI